MSMLWLRESSLDEDPDSSTNAVKQSIKSIRSSSPAKSMWLELFTSFRILKTLYANPDIESSGLRLLGWSNLFSCLHQDIAGQSQQPSIQATVSDREVFSIQRLEEYAKDVIVLLVDEAYDLMNQNGCSSQQTLEIEGAFEEMKRDFMWMLEIQRVGHGFIEMQHAGMESKMESLLGAMGELGIEFKDPVQEMNTMAREMSLRQ